MKFRSISRYAGQSAPTQEFILFLSFVLIHSRDIPKSRTLWSRFNKCLEALALTKRYTSLTSIVLGLQYSVSSAARGDVTLLEITYSVQHSPNEFLLEPLDQVRKESSING